MKEPMICLRPGCGQPSKTRGLCQRCYAAAGTLVKEKKVTWQELVSAGKALEAKRWFGNSTGPARLWLLGDQADNGKVVVAPVPKPKRHKEIPVAAVASQVAKNQVMICADCNEPLTGQYARTRGGQVLCVPCAQNRAKSNVPTRLE